MGDGDVEIPVAVKIRQRALIARRLHLAKIARQGEKPGPVIEEDLVLPGPVTTIDDHGIQIAIPVNIAKADRGRQLVLAAKDQIGMEPKGCCLCGRAQHQRHGQYGDKSGR